MTAIVDAGETDDSSTFNLANEWLTRDVDSNSSANYTLAHDAVGNMTDDGKDYTFVYDVFGRLVKVKARAGGATVAEYGYDGLGQRIWYHADEDADGTVEASNDDPKYNFVYDDRWRIIATYRVPYSGSDTTPKETYVWHASGMDGHGGSSYIDSVTLRAGLAGIDRPHPVPRITALRDRCPEGEPLVGDPTRAEDTQVAEPTCVARIGCHPATDQSEP